MAFRDGPWDGWMCREWKSGVKLVNAICAGRPIISQDSEAWRNLTPRGVRIESLAELPDAFSEFIGAQIRSEVVKTSQRRPELFTAAQIGRQYLELLAPVARQGVSA